MTNEALQFLSTLENTISQRIADDQEGSYTATLARTGKKRVAQKVGEESIELALASVAGTRDEQIEEAADLLYHTLVMLTLNTIRLDEVVAVLAERHNLRDA